MTVSISITAACTALFKWLNLHAFCQATFPADQINRIRYFTARVKARPNDPDKPVRQDTFFRALRTLPELHIHEGSYIEKPVTLPQHPIPAPPAKPTFVTVVRSEEKGSDVNLATYLLIDAFDKDFEAAVVISNDSDLAEPIRLVRARFNKRIIVLFPCSRPGRSPSVELRMASGIRGGKQAADRRSGSPGGKSVSRVTNRCEWNIYQTGELVNIIEFMI